MLVFHAEVFASDVHQGAGHLQLLLPRRPGARHVDLLAAAQFVRPKQRLHGDDLAPLEGRAAALDEQDVQHPCAQGQREDVDGHGDGGELARVVGREECALIAAVRAVARVALPVRV
ncbi:hypothetical protein ACWCXK_39555, partial [Streptomyces sp. NPDC001739]